MPITVPDPRMLNVTLSYVGDAVVRIKHIILYTYQILIINKK